MPASAPEGLLERLQSLWCEALDLAPGLVQPESHFLLLGGDSLQLARLLSLVQNELGVSLPLYDLARYATPLRMLACCSAQALVAQAGQETLLMPGSLHSVPATPLQQGIWLAEQLAAPYQLYLSSVQVFLSGALDLAALQHACTSLFQVYPLLLARLFHDPDSRRLQLSLTDSARLPELELHRCAPAALPACLREAVEQPLALDAGPLCRLHLFRLAPQCHVLLVSCHHVISDGWSGGILLQQLAKFYSAAVRQASLPLPAADWRFLAYCHRVDARALVVCPEQLLWWRDQLCAMDLAQTWIWHGHAEESWPHPIQAREFDLHAELLDALRLRAADLGQSLFLLFLHAVKGGLYDCSGEPDQILLLPVAERRYDEESSIGSFIETFLLPGKWQQTLPLETALQVTAELFASAQRRHLPLTTLVAALRPRLLPDGNPWSTILFAYQSYPQPVLGWEGLAHRVEAVSDLASQYALKLEILPGQTAWTLRIEYATTLLDATRVAGLGAAILARLQRFIAS